MWELLEAFETRNSAMDDVEGPVIWGRVGGRKRNFPVSFWVQDGPIGHIGHFLKGFLGVSCRKPQDRVPEAEK